MTACSHLWCSQDFLTSTYLTLNLAFIFVNLFPDTFSEDGSSALSPIYLLNLLTFWKSPTSQLSSPRKSYQCISAETVQLVYITFTPCQLILFIIARKKFFFWNTKLTKNNNIPYPRIKVYSLIWLKSLLWWWPLITSLDWRCSPLLLVLWAPGFLCLSHYPWTLLLSIHVAFQYIMTSAYTPYLVIGSCTLFRSHFLDPCISPL